MKRLRCPLNGLRDIAEFAWLGWVAPMPDPGSATDDQWSAYLLGTAADPETVRLEWWLHRPSGHVFVARRDIVADRVLATFAAEDLPPGLRDRGGPP